jgi:hypothetical protein
MLILFTLFAIISKDKLKMIHMIAKLMCILQK